MDFKLSLKPKNESVAEKARRERQEREAKRKAQAEDTLKAEAASKVQRWWRFERQRKAYQPLLLLQWDAWTGYDQRPADNSEHADGSQSATTPIPTIPTAASPMLSSLDVLALAPLQPWELLRIIGVFLSFYKENNHEHTARLSFLCKLLLDLNKSTSTISMAPVLGLQSKRETAISILTKFMRANLRRVCQSDIQKLSNEPNGIHPYLSGPELRLCVIFWDLKRWGADPLVVNAAFEARQKVVNELHGFILLKEAMILRVKALITINSRK
ncbi:hypothetical protein HDV05_007133, partial [Chytridiales sp. JEL 0842]